MDIYFCDLCGVRVTDADLRAGHGIREGHDVICSGCLELGQHKEWLNRRVKTSPAHATGLGGHGDRVATLEEGVPSSRVSPRVIAGELTPSGSVPLLPEDHDATTKVPTLGEPTEIPLSGAASLFSALGTSHAERVDDDEEDDLPDQADQPPVTTTPEPAASPFAQHTDNAEKAETTMVKAIGGLDKTATEETEAVASAPAPRVKTTTKEGRSSTSARHPKTSNGKKSSSRRTKQPAGTDVGRLILMISLISLGVIMLAFGGLIAKKKGWFGKAQSAAIGIDGEEIKTQIQSTKAQVVAALRAEDVAQLEAAKAALERTQVAVDTFVSTAERSGNSEDQINYFLERVAGWSGDHGCYLLKRNVHDMLFRLKSH